MQKISPAPLAPMCRHPRGGVRKNGPTHPPTLPQPPPPVECPQVLKTCPASSSLRTRRPTHGHNLLIHLVLRENAHTNIDVLFWCLIASAVAPWGAVLPQNFCSIAAPQSLDCAGFLSVCYCDFNAREVGPWMENRSQARSSTKNGLTPRNVNNAIYHNRRAKKSRVCGVKSVGF